jgi:glycosyltransferase involved in cell wall biosynthesis
VRIAVVTTSWPSTEDDPDGHFVRAEVRRLERDGHAVTVVAPRKGGAFGAPGVAARLRERPWRGLDAAGWIASARRRMAALPVDRAIAHWCVPSGWPVATASEAPLELVSHGGDVRLLLALPGGVRRLAVDALARRSALWTFVSQPLLDSLLGALDAPTRAGVERVARVDAPLLELPDVRDDVERRRRQIGAFGTVRVGVCVARLVPTKRIDRVIEHVARARDVDLLVVVGDGPERARLERLARERAVQARFQGSLGRREALVWIGAAAVVFHASEAEGLSTVVREAEALGTPVVRV